MSNAFQAKVRADGIVVLLTYEGDEIATLSDEALSDVAAIAIENQRTEQGRYPLTGQQRSMLIDIAGLEDQICKGHHLNVHFRAFDLAHKSWMEHIRQNAVAGARSGNSPLGAVLDDQERRR